MKTIFLSAALFSAAERAFNARLRDALTAAGFAVLLPQEFPDGPSEVLFRQCVEGIDKADLVVAVVEGTDVDSGVAFEMGYARGTGKPIVALRTDYRQAADSGGLNLMLLHGATKCVFASEGDPLAAAVEAVREWAEGR